jgi:hypothetical protein
MLDSNHCFLPTAGLCDFSISRIRSQPGAYTRSVILDELDEAWEDEEVLRETSLKRKYDKKDLTINLRAQLLFATKRPEFSVRQWHQIWIIANLLIPSITSLALRDGLEVGRRTQLVFDIVVSCNSLLTQSELDSLRLGTHVISVSSSL